MEARRLEATFFPPGQGCRRVSLNTHHPDAVSPLCWLVLHVTLTRFTFCNTMQICGGDKRISCRSLLKSQIGSAL